MIKNGYPISEAVGLKPWLGREWADGGVISGEFLDIDHFREQLRGWDTSAVQIERGPLSIRLHSIDLDGLIFSTSR